MGTVQVQSLDQADETRSFPDGVVEMVTIGDTMLGRARFQPGRLIWNLETPDLHGDLQRLKAAGATVVQEPYQPDEDPEGWIATFADPDDNYFQLLGPIPS
jgi:predicted enzyme related to lactoylglutathione lyase